MQLTLLKEVDHYRLWQDKINRMFYVTVPSDQNHKLYLHPPDITHMTLDAFIQDGFKCVLYALLTETTVPLTNKSTQRLMNREIIMLNSKTRLHEHSIVYTGMIKLTLNLDNETELVPIKLTMDRDGNFFNIVSPVLETPDCKIYYGQGQHLTLTHKLGDEMRISSTALEPNAIFFYAACCMSAVSHFGSYRKNLN